MIREKIFFKSHAENKAERLVSDLFLFFKNDLFEVKASRPQLIQYISISSQLGAE